MSDRKKPANPFYGVLLAVGIVFVLTACSYFVMTLQGREASYGRSTLPRDNTAEDSDSRPNNEAFAQFMDQYGFTALMIELGLLAAATFGAIGTDEYWMRQAKDGTDNTDSKTTDTEDMNDESESSRSD
ncbi:MAG: hypothetical protein CMJ64_18250 [Planctomycetaceae bacterium]|nr:hypothetical protein [Planctomycetaceae bacterium]